MGPNLDRILENYWLRQRIFPKVGKYRGALFSTGRGVTQGDSASLLIFIILVDAVVLEVLEEVCSPQEAHNGMEWEAGERNLVFIVDSGRIAGRDHEWVQAMFDGWG